MTNADPIRLAILTRALSAAADEMGINLVRSAFSTIVRESHDCSTAILDPDGWVVAQAEMIPIQTAGLGGSFRQAAKMLDLSNINEQSAIVLNDPYSGGQHLNDIILFQPILLDGVLLGWVGNTAHHLDIGGGAAGVNTFATELIQEGIIIPPLLIDVERDWNDGIVQRLIFANIRTAEVGLGDMNAQFAANHIGRERVLELARREGVQALRNAMTATLDHSERSMRASIADIPDGSYQGQAFIDRDVFEDKPIEVFVTLHVKGTEIVIDFDGSSPQVKGMFNCPLASTRAAVITAVRSIFADRDFPVNDGCHRPFDLRVPEGTVLNPFPGAPVRARMQAAYRTMDAVHAALGKAVPNLVPAQGFNSTTGVYLSQPGRNGTSIIYADLPGGGYGGARGYDGAHALDAILGSCRRVPIEAAEQIYSFVKVRSQTLAEDSCGAGQWRGGLGYTQCLEILEPGVTLTIYTDHHKLPPKGLADGHDGSTGRLRVLRGKEVFNLGASATFPLEAGDILELTLGGGAGWGDPGLRSPDLVAADIENGYISQDYARRHHGWNAAKSGAEVRVPVLEGA